MATLTAISALIWVYLLELHGRFWQAGPILTPHAPSARPDVVIVVPARDEAASIAAVLRSLLAQDYAGSFRVIVVDDNSTDGTGDIARERQRNSRELKKILENHVAESWGFIFLSFLNRDSDQPQQSNRRTYASA